MPDRTTKLAIVRAVTAYTMGHTQLGIVRGQGRASLSDPEWRASADAYIQSLIDSGDFRLPRLRDRAQLAGDGYSPQKSALPAIDRVTGQGRTGSSATEEAWNLWEACRVPWLPELFSAQALARLEAERGRELRDTVPYYAGLLTGETDALVGSFTGEPELHDPVRGRIKGRAGVHCRCHRTQEMARGKQRLDRGPQPHRHPAPRRCGACCAPRR